MITAFSRDLHVLEFKKLVLEFYYIETNASVKIANLVTNGKCVAWLFPKISEKEKNINTATATNSEDMDYILQ